MYQVYSGHKQAREGCGKPRDPNPSLVYQVVKSIGRTLVTLVRLCFCPSAKQSRIFLYGTQIFFFSVPPKGRTFMFVRPSYFKKFKKKFENHELFRIFIFQ